MYITKLASSQLPLWNMLEKANIDPLPLFHKVRMDPDLMHQANARYPVERIKALISEVGEKVNDPCFGLSVASCWHPSHLGALGHVLLMSKTLRDTLERLLRYHKVLSDSPLGELQEDKLRGTLSLVALFEGKTARLPFREDSDLAWVVSILRMNYQRDLAPLSVDFTHSSPDCAGKFYEYFQCPIKFDAERTRLTLSLEVAEELLPGSNEELAAFSDQLMARYLNSLSEHNLVTKVKKAIVGHLPSGEATVDKVASDLYMSTRTLQRSLQQQDSSFHILLNEARMELAMQYVSDPNMNLTEVAFLLGFAEQSSFSRSFKRWTGQSPVQHRKAV
jgi:AraC-like DNA-binding protein